MGSTGGSPVLAGDSPGTFQFRLFSFSAFFLSHSVDRANGTHHFLTMNAIVELPATELGAMIVCTPDILGGCPRIKGHRIAVHRVAGWWKLGLSIEQIGERLPSLGAAEIHAALAFYHLHRAEIEHFLEAERAACRSLERPPST